MDKTSWIVVSTCIALLGLSFYYKEDPAPATPPAAQVAAANPSADPTSPVTQPELAPVVGTTPAIAKEIASLTSRNSKGEPVARYSISDIGGSVQYVEMMGKAINSTKENLQDNVRINGMGSQGIGTLMFGLSEAAAPRYDQTEYSLISADDNQVVLQGNAGAIIIRKTYRLRPVSQGQNGQEPQEGLAYMLDMDITVLNASEQERQAINWGIYTGLSAPISQSEGIQYTYYVSYEDKNFEKKNAGSFRPWFGDNKERIFEKTHQNLEWAGSMNQYYASLVRPNAQSQTSSFYAAPSKVIVPAGDSPVDAVELGLGMPDFRLAAAAGDVPAVPQNFSYTLFTGPKLNMMLDKLNEEYHRVDTIMDYGVLTFISYPMNWLINIFYGWFGNWGWAIVAMTFVVRMLIWPLYRKSYMSMKRMSLLQPQMKELKEKYPNDPQKVNMDMMKLYKKYGISPLGGCLPMFLQIPIFFAFFYVLQTAAEFRGASFIGWVSDLSQMDTVAVVDILGWNLPINILPIVMAVSMLVQMRMTPQAGDPTQQKIMKFMPLMFFAFCYTYPSALALYWTTQNIISIGQTWIIQRLTPPTLQEVQVKKGGKKGFFERMMEQQQAALAEQQKRAGGMRDVTRRK